jgi:hypothetical protein
MDADGSNATQLSVSPLLLDAWPIGTRAGGIQDAQSQSRSRSMTLAQPTRGTRAGFVVACLATLALAVAACSSTSQPASPSASVSSSTGAEPSASQVPSAIQPSVASQALPAGHSPAATPTPGAAAKPSAGPVITLPPAANRPQTLHVLEDPGKFTFIQVGSLTGCTSSACQGDRMIGRSRMLDAATRKEVGAFLVDCFLVDPTETLYHCPANTITLTGRGQIVFTETLLWGSGAGEDTWATWAPWPIIGGTGEFLGATGTIDSPADSTWSAGDFVITLTN